MIKSINFEQVPEQMTRSQLVKLLDITYPTLDRWIRIGRISKGTKIFSNRIYTKAEVMKALRWPKRMKYN
jgi:predicted site-specific integrase-resolvase